MQIVIDVSEEEYESCKKHFENLGKREVINDYEYAIATGTPLPKDHGRIIDEHDLVFEDIECTDGNTYMVVHAPYVDGANTIVPANKEE